MRENQFFFNEPEFETVRDFENESRRKGKRRAELELEKCQYFWWWYALTLNENYIRLCEKHDGKSVYDPISKEDKMYNDLGDVRYEGNRYEAFLNWWNDLVVLPNTDPIPNRPVKKGMTRGEYLFSEPLLDGWILQVEDLEQAEKSLSLDSHALISIPLTTSKKHTEKRIKQLLERFHPAFIDPTNKDPKKSKALYKPTSNPQAKKLEMMFRVYDKRTELERNGEQVSNYVLAQLVGINVQLEGSEGQDTSGEMEQYIRDGERMSKLYGDALKVIKNVGDGMFP